MRGLSDISKWQVIQLATNGGFTDRYIASYVFGKPLHRVTDHQLHQVRSYRLKERKLLMDWRNGMSSLAKTHASSVTKITTRRAKRRA